MVFPFLLVSLLHDVVSNAHGRGLCFCSGLAYLFMVSKDRQVVVGGRVLLRWLIWSILVVVIQGVGDWHSLSRWDLGFHPVYRPRKEDSFGKEVGQHQRE